MTPYSICIYVYKNKHQSLQLTDNVIATSIIEYIK